MTNRYTSHFRRLTTTAALAICLLAINSNVGATTQTTTQVATAGNVTASYRFNSNPPFSQHSFLKITRQGKVLYDQAVSSAWCGKLCWVADSTVKVVHVVKLQPNGVSSVVLDLFSGGAHCCIIEQVYSLKTHSSVVQKSERNFGDPGAELVKLGKGGSFDFLSADDRFAYEFTDYAASGMPIQILSFSRSKFHDVTRSFPTLIAKDADMWLSIFKSQASSHYDDSVGVAAAWAADEDMLGHSSKVASFLAVQEKAGHLNTALSPITPNGKKFVAALQTFLRQRGYLKP